jgi:hypothetical protein
MALTTFSSEQSSFCTSFVDVPGKAVDENGERRFGVVSRKILRASENGPKALTVGCDCTALTGKQWNQKPSSRHWFGGEMPGGEASRCARSIDPTRFAPENSHEN